MHAGPEHHDGRVRSLLQDGRRPSSYPVPTIPQSFVFSCIFVHAGPAHQDGRVRSLLQDGGGCSRRSRQGAVQGAPIHQGAEGSDVLILIMGSTPLFSLCKEGAKKARSQGIYGVHQSTKMCCSWEYCGNVMD
jgi:hypothetical protein